MPVIFDLTSLITVPTDVDASLTENWSGGLSDSAIRKIKDRWDTVAKDPAAWANNVAAPSTTQWAPMLSATFVSRSGRTSTEIAGQHYSKLADSHANAVAAHDRAFADDGASFKASVEAKKDNWARGVAGTLALTGERKSGKRGPAVKVVCAFTNDPSFQRDIGAGDVMSGTFQPATPFVDPSIRQQAKAAIMGILTQGGVLVLKGVTALADINARLDLLITGFLDAAYVAPPTSFINFEHIDAGYILHMHVETA